LAARVVPVEKAPEPAPEKVTFDLYAEAQGTTTTDEQVAEAREARLTPNEHQQRVEERMARMREMNMRMRSPNAVAEYEREPAYVRKKVQINDAPHSTDSNISRYTLSEGTDENGERRVELKRNNPYLHDKVD
jgi:cell division protein FtsZ